MQVTVIPKINFLGSIRSAKKASHHRYENLLKKKKQKEANRLHLMSGEPTIPDSAMARDTCYKYGVLDPCNDATYEFIKDVIKAVNNIYKSAGVPLTEFHAGGDETTRYFGLFPQCKTKKISQKMAMKKMLNALNREVRKYKAKLRVNEEAVIDPDTKRCFKVCFHNTIPTIFLMFCKKAWFFTCLQYMFLAPLAVGQQAYVMARCPSSVYGLTFISSSEHNMLRVSYCDRSLSGIRPAVREQLLKKSSPTDFIETSQK